MLYRRLQRLLGSRWSWVPFPLGLTPLSAKNTASGEPKQKKLSSWTRKRRNSVTNMKFTTTTKWKSHNFWKRHRCDVSTFFFSEQKFFHLEFECAWLQLMFLHSRQQLRFQIAHPAMRQIAHIGILFLLPKSFFWNGVVQNTLESSRTFSLLFLSLSAVLLPPAFALSGLSVKLKQPNDWLVVFNTDEEIIWKR